MQERFGLELLEVSRHTVEDHCDGHGKELVLGPQKRTLKWTQDSEGFGLVACPWVIRW